MNEGLIKGHVNGGLARCRARWPVPGNVMAGCGGAYGGRVLGAGNGLGWLLFGVAGRSVAMSVALGAGALRVRGEARPFLSV